MATYLVRYNLNGCSDYIFVSAKRMTLPVSQDKLLTDTLFSEQNRLYDTGDIKTLSFMGIKMAALPSHCFSSDSAQLEPVSAPDKRSWQETKPRESSSLRTCEVLGD